MTPCLGIPRGSVNTVHPREGGILGLEPVVAEHRESRLIGIMTGSFYADQHQFTHAGLSYFTRSAFVLALIKRARELKWVRPVE